MTDNLPALTHDGKRSSISAVSPQPRLSPLFRRLLWGVTAPRNTRYYSLLGKEAWRNFRELRKAEVQLRRRPTSRSSATEGPPPPRPPYALPTHSHRGSGRPGPHRLFFTRSQFYSPGTVFRDENLEAHRRVFCTLNG